MAGSTATKRLPKISLERTDHGKLSRLADVLFEKDPALADRLADELDRATVVEDGTLPAKTVRMGSLVTFAVEGEDAQTVQLVFPGEADIAANRLSILTPIGAALIGLSAGQSIIWPTRDGRSRNLHVLEVRAG